MLTIFFRVNIIHDFARAQVDLSELAGIHEIATLAGVGTSPPGADATASYTN
jgi:hypothetical protein